ALDRGVPVKLALNHGVSLSFYFDDPEGHLIEVYWPTGVACRPRHGDPIDLTRSEDALRQDVAELAGRAGSPSVGQAAEPDGDPYRETPVETGNTQADARRNGVEVDMKPRRTARSRWMALISSAAFWAGALLITGLIGSFWFLSAADSA